MEGKSNGLAILEGADGPLRELALFAGAGGGILGGLLLGWRTVCAVECDAYCQAVLRARQKDKILEDFPIYDDVRDFPPRDWCYNPDIYVREWYKPRNEWEDRMAGKLKKLTPEQAEECVRMYQAGLSLGPIAQYFQVSRQAMWDLLSRRITLRSQRRFGHENHFYRGGESQDEQAQNLLESAIKAGAVVRRDTCESCGASGVMKDGRSKIQAHHCDYNKPLEVLWLCQRCHHTWHKNNKPKRKEVMTEAPKIDVISGGFP